MRASKPEGPSLNVNVQELAIRSEAAARAALYEISAEVIESPPTPARVSSLALRLDQIADVPPVIQRSAALLKHALEHAAEDDVQNKRVFVEFEQLLDCHAKTVLSLYASDYSVEPGPTAKAQVNCEFESNKPCPYSQYQCVERHGTPCDHLSCALRLAGRLWKDIAAADVARMQESICRRDCYARQHIAVWVPRACDALFKKARTDLYQATAMLIDVLVTTET